MSPEIVVKKKDSRFIFSAIVIVGCSVASVLLVVFVKGVPAVLVAMVMSFAASTLVYAVLGGITEAGFNWGPLKVTGSAAVLLGGAWWINQELERQLRSFNFAAYATPAADWFAIHRSTAAVPAATSTGNVGTGTGGGSCEIPGYPSPPGGVANVGLS